MATQSTASEALAGDGQKRSPREEAHQDGDAERGQQRQGAELGGRREADGEPA